MRTYMQEDIVYQSHGELDAVVYLSLPAMERIEVNDRRACLDGSSHRQTRKCRPLKRHGAP